MPSVLQRHPRYALLSAFLLLSTFLLLASHHTTTGMVSYLYPPGGFDWVSDRIAISERIYQKTLMDREGLIQKFGPTPDRVHSFPADEEPWPPYTVWDFFPAAFNCPHEVERIGALGDGGKWVCGLSRVATKSDCIIYSIGINHESSFEAELLSRTDNCQVWGYDFSVDKFGPEVQDVPSLLRRAHFKPFGLAGTNAHGPDDVNKMYTLQSLMQLNGHSHIDILKVDIESWEFETLTTLIKSYMAEDKPLPFGQLQLEIHVWDKKFSEMLKWWETLEEAGLRPFWTEPNMVYANYNRGGSPELAEYSFLNIRGSSVFTSNEEYERARVVHGPRD